jgi:hypothetical protein
VGRTGAVLSSVVSEIVGVEGVIEVERVVEGGERGDVLDVAAAEAVAKVVVCSGWICWAEEDATAVVSA